MSLTNSKINGSLKNGKFRPLTFTVSRQLDFFQPKQLEIQTGHTQGDWSEVVVKECVDNALDAAEENGLPPIVTVETGEDDHIIISDESGGIPPETVDRIVNNFDTTTSSRERYIGPTRGAQGNALKTLIGFAHIWDSEFVISSHLLGPLMGGDESCRQIRTGCMGGRLAHLRRRHQHRGGTCRSTRDRATKPEPLCPAQSLSTQPVQPARSLLKNGESFRRDVSD